MSAQTLDDMFGDMFDSRAIIERLDELESAAGEEPSELGCSACGEGSTPSATDPTLCQEHADELAALRVIAAEGEDVDDWQYGETFIPEHQFEEYARELAEDIGAITGDESWPLSYIDWARASDALKMDYTEFEFTYNGTTYSYWAR
jgi:hypothetical protein